MLQLTFWPQFSEFSPAMESVVIWYIWNAAGSMARLNFENCVRKVNCNTTLILLATCLLYPSPNFGRSKRPRSHFSLKRRLLPYVYPAFYLLCTITNICHPFLESFCISGQFLLSGNNFSATYEASEFCGQIAVNSPQHLRPCLSWLPNSFIF